MHFSLFERTSIVSPLAMFGHLKTVLVRHRLAFLCACLAGVIGIYPQLGFIFSLGEDYRGVFFQQAANEDGYMSIMREIQDGHLKAASVPFYEYKDAYPLLPPTVPFIYAALSTLTGLSLSTILVISKFIQPVFLFLVVYALALTLLSGEDGIRKQIAAITLGVLIVLGFDLVDYRSWLGFFRGEPPRGLFLIWTRTVNPFSGAVFLFGFLIALWRLWTGAAQRGAVIIAAALLALMMASYFFSWTLAVAIVAVCAFIALLREKWALFRRLLFIPLLGFVLSLPYWIMMFQASALQFYAEAATRIGLSVGHAPHWNKFLIAVTLFFALASLWHFWYRKKEDCLPDWWWFALALLGAGFLAYNQQVITGREIWYYHYVFYTIPIGYLVVTLIFWQFVRPSAPALWTLFSGGVVIASAVFAFYIQASMLEKNYTYYADQQKYAALFDFLNTHAPKDCVVFANQREIELSTLITAYTHCNTYFSGERHVIAPPERFVHNYLSLLRLRGVEAAEIDEYLSENVSEAKAYLHYTITYTLGFSDPKLDAEIVGLPLRYKAFMRKDFYEELQKYRVDYIFTETPLSPAVRASLPLESVFEEGGLVLYALRPKK